jgi:hypothetical protein
MAYGWIMLKLKDFEGIYATAYQRQSHLSGLHDETSMKALREY